MQWWPAATPPKTRLHRSRKSLQHARGAGIGAGVGAALGCISTRNKSCDECKNTIVAVAGGGAGYYMDSREAGLRMLLRESGVSVVREGVNINLVMPGNITFDTNSEHLKDNFNDILKSVAIVLAEYDKTIIAVSGHTDSTGSDSYNQSLSEKRAAAVADYLKEQQIPDVRFEVIDFAEKYPIADNSTDEGRAQNRRGELTLVPITEDMVKDGDSDGLIDPARGRLTSYSPLFHLRTTLCATRGSPGVVSAYTPGHPNEVFTQLRTPAQGPHPGQP